MPELTKEPCPFCRSRQLSVEPYSTGKKPIFHVNCEKCGAAGPAGSSESDAVRLWNRRPGDGHA